MTKTPIILLNCTGLLSKNYLLKEEIENYGFQFIEGYRYEKGDWVLYYEPDGSLFLADPDWLVRLDCKCYNVVMFALLLMSVGLAKEVEVEYLTE